MVTAKASGHRVEDLSQRTETDSTYANPEGTWTTETTSEPFRVQDKSAQWHDIDTTLVKTDEGWKPQYADSDLVLSDGGDRAFASMTEGGKDLSWTWPSQLPEPEVDGNTATYRDVVPGGDLVVTALATGFSHDIVLNQAPDPDAAPLKITTPIVVDNGAPVSVTEDQGDGSLSVSTRSGDSLVDAQQPIMFDAATDPKTQEPTNTTPVDAAVTKTGAGSPAVTLTPDADFLSDPTTQYPVTIDPSWSTWTTGDTYVMNQDQPASAWTSEYLSVGSTDAGAHKRRTFAQFADNTWNGKHILSAQLRIQNVNAASCSPSATLVQRVTENWTPSGLNWSNQPSATATGQATFAPSYGIEGSCPNNFALWDVTQMVQTWATTPSSNHGLRIVAGNESSSTSWKVYSSANFQGGGYGGRPRISFTYNSIPTTSATPTVAPYGTYTPPGGTPTTYVGSRTPSFSTKSSDADGDNLQQTFEVATTSGGTPVATCSASSVAAGGTGTCQLPDTSALTNGATYFVRAKATDGTDTTPYSPSYKFTVSEGTPAKPTISCPSQADGSWSTTAPGGTIACTITTASGDTVKTGWVDYTVGNATETRVPVPSNGSVPITVPGTQGRHIISARAESVGGVKSDPTDYAFGFGTHVTLDTPGDGTPIVTTNGVKLAASGPPIATGEALPDAQVQWRLAGSGDDSTTGWTEATAGSVDLAVTKDASGAVAVKGVWNSATAEGDDLDPRLPALLEVQVCIKYAGGTDCSSQTTPRQINRVPHAFGDGFPTADAGDGQVALWTGEFTTSETDATLDAGITNLSISRDASTYAGPALSKAAGAFGPGWVAAIKGPDGGDADLQILDRTRADGTIVAIDGEGSTMTFAAGTGQLKRRTTATITAGTWRAVDTDTIADGTTAKVSTSGANTTFTIVEPGGDTTVFTTTSAVTSGTAATFVPTSVTQPGDPSATTYSYDSDGRVTRILAPVPTGVTCAASGTLAAGCRALTVSYAISTTAQVWGSLGDYTGQVSSISSVVGKGTTNTTSTLATYRYDFAGHLREVTDPRNNLTTSYTYDLSDNQSRLASVGQPGLTPTNYEYAGADHRLARVKRDRPAASGGGTATLATILYNIPVSGSGTDGSGGTGLPNMSAATIGAWGQTSIPAHGTAVFGPDQPVTSLDSAQVPTAAWADADLSYTDARGYEINTAANGAGAWQYTATDYDTLGNPIRELDEGDVAAIHTGQLTASAAGTITVYNDQHTNAAGDVTLPAGTQVTDSYDTARWVVLSDGTRALARLHTHTTYDEGAPNGGIAPDTGQEYGLPTTQTVTAADPGDYSTLDTISMNKTNYADAVDGNTDAGWAQGLAGSITQVMGEGQADIVNRTRYDTRGRVLKQLQPKSNGADAGTRITDYYTAGGTGTCGSKPLWAGAVCQTRYAAAPSSGPALPTTTVTAYNDQLQPLVTTETANGATRTTTMSYRLDGATATSATTTANLAGSQSLPPLVYSYDSSTGLPTQTTASGTGAGDPITTGYDTWGRQTTYSAAAGETTTTAYDAAGRVSSVTDPLGTATYTYDGTDASGRSEHRGMATKVRYSRSGGDVTISGAYDAAGTLTRQDLPGGITQRTNYDAAGEPIGLSYSGQVTTTDNDGNTHTDQDQPWLAWSQDNDATGRVRRDWTPDGAALNGATGSAAGYAREYTYDHGNRLTEVVDKTALPGGGTVDPDNPDAPGTAPTTCQIRDYAFDSNGNRTALKRTPQAADGSCQAGAKPTTTSWSYDNADRITGGYTYDAFGRTTSIPQVDTPAAANGSNAGPLTLSYYDDDSARTITQNNQTTNYTLDTDGRRTSSASGPTGGSVTSTTVRHYTDDSDNPAWTSTTGTGAGTSRYLDDLGGDLGITLTNNTISIGLNNLHGDTLTTCAVPASGSATTIEAWQPSDEYGARLNEGSASQGGQRTFGWLGAKERASDDTGLVLMGARLYNPPTGSFTSTDPQSGANSTLYAYPQDPINRADTSGESPFGGVGPLKKTCRRFYGPIKCAAVLAQTAVIAARFRSNSNRGNAVRHFIWMEYLSWFGGTGFAAATGAVHEKNSPGKQDSKRDKKNNKYAQGYYRRHMKYVNKHLGKHFLGNDINWLASKANSLYDRGYLWKLNKHGRVVHSNR